MHSVTQPIAALIPSGMEWLWVLIIVLLLFGGAKLPSLARGLGQSIREFKKASSEDDSKSEAKKPESTKAPGAN